MAGVKAAVELHQKWYADRGLPDRILFEPLIQFDKATNTPTAATDQYVTAHLHAPANMPKEKRDAAYDAFVAAYAANSTVTSTTLTCLP